MERLRDRWKGFATDGKAASLPPAVNYLFGGGGRDAAYPSVAKPSIHRLLSRLTTVHRKDLSFFTGFYIISYIPAFNVMDNPYFDRNTEVEIKTGGNLPHWNQKGKYQYVTFRLADSLPQSEIRRIKAIVQRFEENHPKPWNETVQREYWALIGPEEERLLDNGFGECLLREKKIRDLLEEVIMFRNNIDYSIIAYVIMPNHVHLLLQVFETKSLSTILHTIKGYSANMINRIKQRSGKLWKNESFDRIVRNEDELKHYYNYIRSNPRFLLSSDYTLYC